MKSSAAAQQMSNINDYCPFLDTPYVTVAKGNPTFACQYLYKYHPLILESPLSTYAVLEKYNISTFSPACLSRPLVVGRNFVF